MTKGRYKKSYQLQTRGGWAGWGSESYRHDFFYAFPKTLHIKNNSMLFLELINKNQVLNYYNTGKKGRNSIYIRIKHQQPNNIIECIVRQHYVCRILYDVFRQKHNVQEVCNMYQGKNGYYKAPPVPIGCIFEIRF